MPSTGKETADSADPAELLSREGFDALFARECRRLTGLRMILEHARPLRVGAARADPAT